MFELAENWTLEQLDYFDDILDVRSPAEYALDHLPQALNFPVLDDAERVHIGTLYKKVSRFEAKKQGAALVATHIASHIKKHFGTKAEAWQPLVYCWRGGSRSAAMVQVLNDIGWRAQQLPGGYKSYRSRVIEKISELACQLHFTVLCGRTGVGKTKLLQALRKQSKQVLDLEDIANHKGSVLGEPTQGAQPTQKGFESRLCNAMMALDAKHIVYVEAESSKIGRLQLPAVLLQAMHSGQCVHIAAAIASRVSFLSSEYQHFLQNSELFKQAVERLTVHAGEKKITHWLSLHEAGRIAELVEDLLVSYYDPFYTRSMQKNFKHYKNADTKIQLDNIDEGSLTTAAEAIEQMHKPNPVRTL